MQVVGLKLGKTYESPEGGTYEILKEVSLTDHHNIPRKMFLVRKDGSGLGTLPMNANYEGWKEI